MRHLLLEPLLGTLYPHQCRVCGDLVDSIRYGSACSACWAATRIFDGSETTCSKCGAFSKDKRLNIKGLCGQCDDDLYDKAVAVGVYEKALAATVVHLKRESHLPAVAKEMLYRLVDRLSIGRDHAIIPVPLSRKRRFERGHNQAECIGELIAEYGSLPYHPTALVRKEHTAIHRVGMDKKAREATVKNLFEVRTPRLIESRDMILVDDVFTSGSTASYCAKVLKKSGAASVTVITLARAVLYR